MTKTQCLIIVTPILTVSHGNVLLIPMWGFFWSFFSLCMTAKTVEFSSVLLQGSGPSGLQTSAQSTALFTVRGQAAYNCLTESHRVLQSQGCADFCFPLLLITLDQRKGFCHERIPKRLFRFELFLAIQPPFPFM